MTTTKGITSPTLGSLNWDVPLNANFAAIEKAFGESVNVTATSGNYLLSASELGNMSIALQGALTGNLTVQIPAGTAGQWIIYNSTTDATGGPWTVSVTSLAGATVLTVARGSSSIVYCSGSGNLRFADTPPATFTAGANTQIIFNNAGTLTGATGLTTAGTNLTVAGFSKALEVRSANYKDASGANTALINGITPIAASDVAPNVAATGAYAVGSFLFALPAAVPLSPGSTVAGSTLRAASVTAGGTETASTSPSGTWRALGFQTGSVARCMLFLRIA